MTLLLLIKIVVTLITVVVPFLFFPKAKLETAMDIQAHSMTLFRLYGVALLALLGGYSGGIWETGQGLFPWATVIMGIVSNGGAFGVLLATRMAVRQRFLTIFFGTITAALAMTLIFQDRAISPLL